MHSHHSHSGEFVQHAHDSLDEVVAMASKRDLRTFCLTEHMPRYENSHLYPEEKDSGTTVTQLQSTFDQYYERAREYRQKHLQAGSQMHILVGFETEAFDLAQVKSFVARYDFDMFVGSVHHVREIPIDYDAEQWLAAAKLASPNGSLVERVRALFIEYFDLQYQVITELRPPVIGHFDLIQLFAQTAVAYGQDRLVTDVDFSSFDFDFSLVNEPAVWAVVIRNIEAGIRLGCLFEINTAAIRKGWSGPYPKSPVLTALVERNARVCMSDDSHGMDQITQHYAKAFDYLAEHNICSLHYWDLDQDGKALIRETSLDSAREWARDR